MKYRICYEKKDSLIFISQLDLQKVFQRAFRRGRIQLEYTQGFHPHPKMTYSPPLPLFVSSKEEYLDVALRGDIAADEVHEKLAKALPRDLIINSVELLDENSKSLSELLVWADYELILTGAEENVEDAAKAIEEYINNSSEILITKLNKKKQTVTKDIRPLIRWVKAEAVGKDIVVTTSLSLLNDSMLSASVFASTIMANVEKLSGYVIKSISKTGTHQ